MEPESTSENQPEPNSYLVNQATGLRSATGITWRSPLIICAVAALVLLISGGVYLAITIHRTVSPPHPFYSSSLIHSPSLQAVTGAVTPVAVPPCPALPPKTRELFEHLNPPGYIPGKGFTPDTRRSLDIAELDMSLYKYHGANGRYPPSLAALFPAFAPIDDCGHPLAVPPVDPVTHQPYAYTVSPNGATYQLSATLSNDKQYTVGLTNKDIDRGTQSDAQELLGAIQGFEGNEGYFPWQTGPRDKISGTGTECTSNSCADFTGVVGGGNPAYDPPNGTSPRAPTFAPGYTSAWTVDGETFNSSAPVGQPGSSVLDVLGSGSSQELLKASAQRIAAPGHNTLYVFNNGGNGSRAYVCFVPQSSSFKQTALRRWNGGTDCSGSSCGTAGIPADLNPKTPLLGTGPTNKNALFCYP